jgi:hypothetical protein
MLGKAGGIAVLGVIHDGDLVRREMGQSAFQQVHNLNVVLRQAVTDKDRPRRSAQEVQKAGYATVRKFQLRFGVPETVAQIGMISVASL